MATKQKLPEDLTISNAKRKVGPKTRVIVKYDAGFGNQLTIRGKGANLSWDRGIPLQNSKSDEWIWETTTPFNSCEFKILINDQTYENGQNHLLNCGTTIQYSPKF
jgi:hypothetical protein